MLHVLFHLAFLETIIQNMWQYTHFWSSSQKFFAACCYILPLKLEHLPRCPVLKLMCLSENIYFSYYSPFLRHFVLFPNKKYTSISNFRLVLNVVCFLLGNSSASEFYMPTFRNTLFNLHRQVGAEWLGLRNVGVLIRKKFGSKIAQANSLSYFGVKHFPVSIPQHFSDLVILHLPAYEDGTECSETSAYKIQMPGNYSEESIRQKIYHFIPHNSWGFLVAERQDHR